MDVTMPLATAGTAITGALVAGLAFVLATARDEFVRRREAQLKDTNVVQAIREEIEVNQTLVQSHQRLIQREVALLENNQRLVNPLDPLATGFWEIVKFNPPANLAPGTL